MAPEDDPWHMEVGVTGLERLDAPSSGSATTKPVLVSHSAVAWRISAHELL